MEIKDSGNRREFSSGAVRDINEGKGRCDLLPLGVIGEICDNTVFFNINEYIRTGDKMLTQRVSRISDFTGEETSADSR